MPRPPKTFNGFVGQTRITRFIKKLLSGAKLRGDACPSMMFIGKTGHGKTSLAEATVTEYGSDLHLLFSGQDVSPYKICTVLQEVQQTDFVIIDEAHSLKLDTQHILHLAWDKGKIPAVSENQIDRSEFIDIPDFTMILCTNHPGKVNKALRSRLLSVEFDPYNEKELKMIADKIAEERGLAITGQAANLLARVAQGSPRTTQRRMDILFTLCSHDQAINLSHVQELLDEEGIDQHGFSPYQRQYLNHLMENPRGVCSIERLAARIGCGKDYLKLEVEPYLIEQDYVEVFSSRGRKITLKGMNLIEGRFWDQKNSNVIKMEAL